MDLKGVPFNDDDLVYDFAEHRYFLTIDSAQNNLGIDLANALGSEAKATRLVRKVSDFIYDYIYNFTREQNAVLIEYKIAKNDPQSGEPEWRGALKKAMIEQLDYALQSDGDLIGYQHGVNIDKGTFMNVKNLRGRVEICAAAEKILKREQLLFRGMLNSYINIEDFRSDY